MPRVVKPGDVVNGYTIVRHLNTGMMALSFEAQSPSNKKVFFKQYKSPTVAIDWYKGYISYQIELRRRLQSPDLRQFTVRFVDSFEADWGPRTFFQVFEFAEGQNMEKILEQLRAKPASVPWEKRLIFAKVMMNAIHQLHQQNVVHCDLKPPNIQMLVDSTIKAGYQPKLIDLDCSVLRDRKAPWHGEAEYVGSPHYFSLEHLRRQVPEPASDVFTCGLILYDLLAQGHPYLTDDLDSYLKAASEYGAPAPKLGGSLATPHGTELLSKCLHLCLAPDPKTRPTAREVHQALNGMWGGAGSRPGVETPTKYPEEPVKPPKPPITSTKAAPRVLELFGPNGKSFRVRIQTKIGKYLCASFGEEAQFMDPTQFIVDKVDGHWIVTPQEGTRNVSLLNGKLLSTPTALKDGDELGVGNREGDSKLPIKVRLQE